VMNPTRNYNHHKRTEDGCEICGFMKTNFLDYKDFYRKYRPRELRHIAEGEGSSTSHLDTFYPTFRQQEPKRCEHHARSSFDAEDVSQGWLREELVRLFPKARNPSPPYIRNDPGKFPCWISGIIWSSFWTESRV
jgi:hypothetical protein